MVSINSIKSCTQKTIEKLLVQQPQMFFQAITMLSKQTQIEFTYTYIHVRIYALIKLEKLHWWITNTPPRISTCAFVCNCVNICAHAHTCARIHTDNCLQQFLVQSLYLRNTRLRCTTLKRHIDPAVHRTASHHTNVNVNARQSGKYSNEWLSIWLQLWLYRMSDFTCVCMVGVLG